MSVLKDKRTVSKADFINVAHQIFVETMAFLTRLSARYSRLLAEPTAKLAGEVLDEAEKANSIYPLGRTAHKAAQGPSTGSAGLAYGPGCAAGPVL